LFFVFSFWPKKAISTKGFCRIYNGTYKKKEEEEE
jgi:hypothetical protein